MSFLSRLAARATSSGPLIMPKGMIRRQPMDTPSSEVTEEELLDDGVARRPARRVARREPEEEEEPLQMNRTGEGLAGADRAIQADPAASGEASVAPSDWIAATAGPPAVQRDPEEEEEIRLARRSVEGEFGGIDLAMGSGPGVAVSNNPGGGPAAPSSELRRQAEEEEEEPLQLARRSIASPQIASAGVMPSPAEPVTDMNVEHGADAVPPTDPGARFPEVDPPASGLQTPEPQVAMAQEPALGDHSSDRFERPEVQIDQLDVIIHEPAARVPRSGGFDPGRAVRSRYLKRL